MEILLTVVFLVILIALIVLLVWLAKRPLGLSWQLLRLGAGVAMIVAAGLFVHYNNLPGVGMMPGMTYFAETVICFGAMILYFVFAGVVQVVYRIKIKRKNDAAEKESNSPSHSR